MWPHRVGRVDRENEGKMMGRRGDSPSQHGKRLDGSFDNPRYIYFMNS